jgi:serine/threonine protein phosphatase PrpC
MDIFTSAIAAALGNLGSAAVLGAYRAVTTLIQRKFGAESKVAKAIEELEQQPKSEGRKITLKEEAEAAGADKDEEIIKAAEALLDTVKAQPGGEKAVQQIVKQIVIGKKNIVAGVGDVNIKL